VFGLTLSFNRERKYMGVLSSSVVFLAAAVIAVPLFKRFKLGAILGYLFAGMVIGPSMMDWVSDPEHILHFAELGVVLLLFIIGLELEPEKLLKLRQPILVTGGGQLLLTTAVIGVLFALVFGLEWKVGLVIGLALALSSTAFAIQLMAEQQVLRSAPGQKGFAVLLMQDLAVIPILLLVQAFASDPNVNAPAWWVSVGAIVFVLVVGKYLLNPFLRLVSYYGNEESMTAAALLIVIATALGMQEAGLSMGMGAFVAGILLANSSFRHQLETEIEPFKGLLLGLFFIAIGMNLDLQLLVSEPVFIVSMAVLLVGIKTAVIFSILKMAKQSNSDSMRIALMLSQGGEFAFVVMAQAASTSLIDANTANQITLIVGISMALTSPIVILYSLWFNSRNCPAVYDSQSDDDEPKVLIAGFGRFGQISGRILAANRIPFTALDKDAGQIEFVKKFGSKVFFGDATRLDLLKKAGIEHAKILLIAIDSEQDTLKIVELVHHHFPRVKMVVRARNRASVIQLSGIGNIKIEREMFAGGLNAAKHILMDFGFDEISAQNRCNLFARHDEKLLVESIEKNMNESALIEHSIQARAELSQLFNQDEERIG
jgi:CPA2 family monovalent cation:H+ antiporter-2